MFSCFQPTPRIMSSTTSSAGKVALVTGVNMGIGKDMCRQLALRSDIRKVYLGCRNRGRADAAVADLKAEIKRDIFDVIVIDMSDVKSVRTALKNIPEPIDWLFMIAGGVIGPDATKLTADGATTTFATNVLGHTVLLEGLIDAKLLRGGAVLAGSEATVGVPALGIKAPEWKSQSADEFVTVGNGNAYAGQKKPDTMNAYAQVKHIGILYMAAMARRHPELKLVSVSPGNTKGTNAAASVPFLLRMFVKYVAHPIIMPLMGQAHSLEVGTKRLLDGLADPKLLTGHYYASKPTKMSGPLADNTEAFPQYANQQYQDNAFEAVHRLLAA